MVYLTVKEAAEQLNVSSNTIYALLSHRKLACNRIGVGRGAIRISQRDLDTFVQSCQAPTRSETPQPIGRLKHIRF